MGKLQDLKVKAIVEFEDINVSQVSWEFIVRNLLKSEEMSHGTDYEHPMKA